MYIKEDIESEVRQDIDDLRADLKNFIKKTKALKSKIYNSEDLDKDGWWKASLSYLIEDYDKFNDELLDFGEDLGI